MAEGQKPRKHSDESVKLFVGQVPKHMTEAQLAAMFEEFALVDEVNIIKDKATRASRGCCFVICPSREEADKAVDACHNKRTLPGASCPLQVKYADGELERLEHKIFIGMLPKNVSEGEVSALFSQYGSLKDLQILRGSQQTSKGCAFVKYETKEQAVAAIEDLNGKHKMEGSTVPLVVKWADTEKERLARKAQKAQSLASNMANADPTQHPSLFGALPMGYMSPYNGYGYQVQAAGSYGVMQYRLPPGQNHRGGGGTPRNYAVSPAGYVGSVYHPPAQYPVAYPPQQGQGIMSSGPPSPVPPPSSVSSGSPPGDQGFGRVLSAKVFVDKATGVSKCFGFVSYESPSAAQSAISVMNGYQLGGKKLKVQLKRDNKLNKAQ
ncbi:unnamed protein product [Lactuca saligna]|uniref:RRM domain-containing protein n=1 Tax=Lactuca saligna TaxID=75948 RepID=A0AA35ZAJ4_LACSI|nr:unnamed protein product [Lactuca saligna]